MIQLTKWADKEEIFVNPLQIEYVKRGIDNKAMLNFNNGVIIVDETVEEVLKLISVG